MTSAVRGKGLNNMMELNSAAIYRFCGRALALSAACAAFWCAAPEKAAAEARVTAGVEHFNWGEYSNGTKVLDESGLRYAVGFTWLLDGQSGLLLGYNGKYYLGDVKYGGQSCASSGQCSPFSTNNGYNGMLNEMVLHYRLDSEIKPDETNRHYLDLVTGLGLDYWIRDIKGNGGVASYKETYIIGFLRAGLAMLPVKSGMEVAAGLKYPLYLDETVNFKSAGLADADLVLSPKPELSYYLSLGWRFNDSLSVTFDFDSYRFSQSAPVSYTVGGATAGSKVQPESRMEVITLKAGYSF